jgi:hypothetical protein
VLSRIAYTTGQASVPTADDTPEPNSRIPARATPTPHRTRTARRAHRRPRCTARASPRYSSPSSTYAPDRSRPPKVPDVRPTRTTRLARRRRRAESLRPGPHQEPTHAATHPHEKAGLRVHFPDPGWTRHALDQIREFRGATLGGASTGRNDQSSERDRVTTSPPPTSKPLVNHPQLGTTGRRPGRCAVTLGSARPRHCGCL